MSKAPLAFLCVSCYFKGEEFLKGCKDAGNTVFLLTSKKLENKPWPRGSIDEMLYVSEDQDGNWKMKELLDGLSYFMRTRKIDRIVALDDFDVERASHLREHFRIPGMGETTSRYFRDKLAMRMRAADAGIAVPAFSSLFNDDDVNRFADSVPAPWLIKPRSEASATGIKKVHNKEELWSAIHGLGDRRHNYLVERFAPGDVYHVDSLSHDSQIIFTRVSQYLNTPMEVAHGGGIFRSHNVAYGSKDDKALQELNAKVMDAFGMKSSASHSEYIKSKETGEYFFLETSARVGGAHLAEMVAACSGINLWREWAFLETAVAKNEAYKLPKAHKGYSGIIISLSKQEWPEMGIFADPEVSWHMNEPFHVGMVLKADKRERVLELLDSYAHKIYDHYHAAAPLPDKPTH